MSSPKRSAGRARTADRHELYELAVQHPPGEVEFVSTTFATIREREAKTLREDFCGTAVFSLAWVQSDPARTAIGVDLDRDTLDWGLERRIRPAGGDFGSRVELRNTNVLDAGGPQTDVVVAFNFSYWCFDTREALLEYFRVAYDNLVDGGVLFLDVFGGTEVPTLDCNARECEDDEGVINGGQPFTYEWEHVDYNPITARFECAIHFEFDDGSAMRNAFTYSWRVWSIPELRELMLEAGFSKVHLYWERQDDDGEGTGKFFQPRRAENEPVWWTFIVAER